MNISNVPRPDWAALPAEGCVGVEGRVLFTDSKLVVAMLRLSPDGTIHEHAADWSIHAICIEGEGYVSVDDEIAQLHAGQSVEWPAGKRHRLWTEGTSMVTVMLEHLDRR